MKTEETETRIKRQDKANEKPYTTYICNVSSFYQHCHRELLPPKCVLLAMKSWFKLDIKCHGQVKLKLKSETVYH